MTLVENMLNELREKQQLLYSSKVKSYLREVFCKNCEKRYLIERMYLLLTRIMSTRLKFYFQEPFQFIALN